MSKRQHMQWLSVFYAIRIKNKKTKYIVIKKMNEQLLQILQLLQIMLCATLLKRLLWRRKTNRNTIKNWRKFWWMHEQLWVWTNKSHEFCAQLKCVCMQVLNGMSDKWMWYWNERKFMMAALEQTCEEHEQDN